MQTVIISTDDVLSFVDEALDEMVGILRRLGDDLANERPDLQGANSAFVILTHCLGVMEFWGGYMIAGRPIQRDRDGEFLARGCVDDLIHRTENARRQLGEDLTSMDSEAPPRHASNPEDAHLPYARTQAGVLLHILQELTQHLGHMQLTRDVLLNG